MPQRYILIDCQSMNSVGSDAGVRTRSPAMPPATAENLPAFSGLGEQRDRSRRLQLRVELLGRREEAGDEGNARFDQIVDLELAAALEPADTQLVQRVSGRSQHQPHRGRGRV